MCGGDDGARTRDLCRDSVLRFFNDVQTRGEHLRPPSSYKTWHFVDRIVDQDRTKFSYLRLSAIVCPKGSRGQSIKACEDRARRRNARPALNAQETAVPGSCSSHCLRRRSPSMPSFPPTERAAVVQMAAGMAPQDRRKLSILASTDERSNQSLSNSATCARMLRAFVAMFRSRTASDSLVHSVRHLLLVSIACDQTRDSD